jgi:hypothetical protein
MRRHAVSALLLVLCSTPVLGQTDQTASEFKRPAYTDRRFDEDWSGLRGDRLGGTVADTWDRVKFIPLNEEENVWLTIGGQLRERDEYARQFQFGESQPAPTDAYLLSRVRISSDLHAGKYFRVFAEAKSSLGTQRDLAGGNSASFVDGVDLENAFADVVIPLGHAATITIRGE